MVISFKVSKTGKRFNPAPPPRCAASFPVEDEELSEPASKNKSDIISHSTRKLGGEASDTKGILPVEISDAEVSFCLNLFNDGYSVSKPMGPESEHQTSGAVPKFVHPYDRASETLFSAIESGQLPGDILDDIPCKYVNGTLVCEVRDYRDRSSEGLGTVSGDSSPVINRVRLRMSLENIVKDIPGISESDWTYGDLMEVESRILKALQPHLTLDPNPQLERLCNNPVRTKLNLDIRTMRRKRLRQFPEVEVGSDNLNGKKPCVSLGQQSAYENLGAQNTSSMLPLRNNSFGSEGSLLKYQTGVASPRRMKDPRLLSPDGMMMSFPDNNASVSLNGKRENQDVHLSPLMNKRARLDGNLHHLGIENLHGSELQWKNSLMQQQQQQSIGRGIQYPTNNVMQKFSHQYNLKGEPVDNERMDKPDHRMTMGESELANIDPRFQQRVQSQFMRPGLPQTPWNSISQALDSNNNPRKEDPYQKRKLVQSPHVSAGGGLPQSPLSSKSGEFSSGSHQFGAAVSSGHVTQKEKSVGGGDSMQRRNQGQAVAKRRSNSLPKTPTMSGVGSPVSVSNMSVPISASSPAIGSQPLGDQTMLERFSKIEMVATRCQLNSRKSKIDRHEVRNPNSYTLHDLTTCLSNDSNNDIYKDETCVLSKSLIGGNMNIPKTRVLSFTQTEHVIQGNSFQLVTKARTRMILSEKPNDGTVAIHIGEIEDAEYLAAEDYLPTLPNTRSADLLAAQFSSLMAREGYNVEDNLQPKAVQLSNNNPLGQPDTPDMQQQQQPFSEAVSIQTSDTNNNPQQLNSPHNTPLRMLPPGNNNQQIQISQALLQRPQQSEFQRPPLMLSSNMGGLNMGNNNNKHTALQLQLMQQQQRKMMTSGMSSGNNTMMGLGRGGSRISSPMGPTSLSSAVNIANAALRNGTLTSEQAAMMKLRMQQQYQQHQSRSNMLGPARQMHPMLGPNNMNRATINSQMMQQQRAAMGQMGPPKLMPGGMNVYMNQQQQMQLQMQMQQQQQMQHQMQQQQQQQESVVVSPPQVQSPSSMMTHQQRTPTSPQLSTGGMQGMSGPEGGPTSPQLSSQTMGSVGSMSNSPMDMSGVNKNNGQ